MYRQSIIFAAFIVAAALGPSPALAEGNQAFDKGMQPILQSYLKIHDALTNDKAVGVQREAKAIVKAAKKLDAKGVTGEHAKHFKDLPASLRTAAETLSTTKDIVSAREAFKDLSKPMAMWGTMSKPKGIVVAFCSMAKGSWLQKKGDVRNPYYGASMLSCGEVVGGDDAKPKASGSMKHDEMNHGEHAGH